MSAEIPCPAGCGEATSDGLLCRECTSRLRRQLLEIPHLLVDLQDNYARLAQSGTGNGTSRSASTPLPFDWAAAHTRDDVMHTLLSWLGELSNGEPPAIAGNARSITGWLIGQLPTIRGHQAAAGLVDEIGAAHRALRTAIDTPQPRVRVGKCPICKREVTAPIDADEAVCRWCEWAGVHSVLPIDRTRQPQWARAADELVTRAIALDACQHLGVTVNPATFRSWVEREQLTPRPDPSRAGRYLYRLGDVFALARIGKEQIRHTPDSMVLRLMRHMGEDPQLQLGTATAEVWADEDETPWEPSIHLEWRRTDGAKHTATGWLRCAQGRCAYPDEPMTTDTADDQAATS